MKVTASNTDCYQDSEPKYPEATAIHEVISVDDEQ